MVFLTNLGPTKKVQVDFAGFGDLLAPKEATYFSNKRVLEKIVCKLRGRNVYEDH